MYICVCRKTQGHCIYHLSAPHPSSTYIFLRKKLLFVLLPFKYMMMMLYRKYIMSMQGPSLNSSHNPDYHSISDFKQGYKNKLTLPRKKM